MLFLGLHTYAHKHTRTRAHAHVLTHVPENIRGVCVLGGGWRGGKGRLTQKMHRTC